MDWNSFTNETKHDLLIIMVRANKPMRLAGGSIIIMSVETLLKVITFNDSIFKQLSGQIPNMRFYEYYLKYSYHFWHSLLENICHSLVKVIYVFVIIIVSYTYVYIMMINNYLKYPKLFEHYLKQSYFNLDLENIVLCIQFTKKRNFKMKPFATILNI